MEYRELGRTGWKVSALSFGAWAIGGTWGEVDDSESLAALQQASGGTWAGCVYDADRIVAVINAGLAALAAKDGKK